ncbi:MAG: ChbG/HpnK family deacetylase [Planctomycetes bacterium]|nr:ChbG/HpnK family deacetylase [Planctomycetota bacterium]
MSGGSPDSPGTGKSSTQAPRRAPRVIVNADDFGYFDCVSRGIIDAARDGVVRATSLLATAPRLEEHVKWLPEAPLLDFGVHLTLTTGDALSTDMRRFATHLGALRPASIARSVCFRTLRPATVRAEWRAQIDRCIALGVRPVFLNSHEHVHALPSLFDVVLELADAYGVKHVRTPRAAVAAPIGVRSLARAAAFAILGVGRTTAAGPGMLGLHEAGRLCAASVEWMFRLLEPGRVYEIGCHPGRRDEREVSDSRLLRYHDWDGERALLSGPAVRVLAAQYGVELVGFRDI